MNEITTANFKQPRHQGIINNLQVYSNGSMCIFQGCSCKHVVFLFPSGVPNLNSSATDWLQNLDTLKESMRLSGGDLTNIDMSQFQGEVQCECHAFY